jgi:hypothetical protein
MHIYSIFDVVYLKCVRTVQRRSKERFNIGPYDFKIEATIIFEASVLYS